MKQSDQKANRDLQIRTLILMVVFGVGVFIPLMIKLYQVQILEHEKYQGMAVQQQTKDTIVAPPRGTIFDRNHKALAISASVNDVSVDPHIIIEASDKALISQGLGEILGIEPQVILDKIEKYKKKEYASIQLRVEQDVAEKIRAFVVDNELEGKINLTPNMKRYYPNGNFASNVLGFVNSDGKGVEGLESRYNEKLTGNPGRIISARDNRGASFPLQYEKYYDASSGLNMVLTLDDRMQHFLEKHLDTAVVENLVAKRATGIIMDVKTGGILAMATSPSYDPNNRTEITDPAIQAQLAGLEGEELSAATKAALIAQYRNKAVNDTYEPGSTFKIVTASIALEEKVVTMADRFTCNGSIRVAGWNKPMSCHRKIGHGAESFLEGIQNSCNPVFISVGLRIGRQLFWDYMHAFGFFDKTGIDMPGESSSVISSWDVFNYSDVPLATYSFGQTFNVTPIQLIAAASAVANDGKLMWPHIASEFIDDEGNIVESVEPRVVRQVISSETAQLVCSALEEVVRIGTGKNAYVSGYRIAGKTGTSQKIGPAGPISGKYVVSFLGFAPADDPQIAIIVALDEPGGQMNLRSGGQMAAPVVGRILADILPYIGILPQYSADDVAGKDVETPFVKGLDLVAAQKLLKERGMQYRIVGEGDKVLDQLPVPGVKMPKSAEMILYTESQRPEESVKVPNVVGKSPEQANKLIINAGLYMRVSGTTDTHSTSVTAAMQDIAAGEPVPLGTIISVEFRDTSISD